MLRRLGPIQSAAYFFRAIQFASCLSIVRRELVHDFATGGFNNSLALTVTFIRIVSNDQRLVRDENYFIIVDGHAISCAVNFNEMIDLGRLRRSWCGCCEGGERGGDKKGFHKRLMPVAS